eukprot:1250664-Rhodomonas_salina.2
MHHPDRVGKVSAYAPTMCLRIPYAMPGTERVIHGMMLLGVGQIQCEEQPDSEHARWRVLGGYASVMPCPVVDGDNDADADAADVAAAVGWRTCWCE